MTLQTVKMYRQFHGKSVDCVCRSAHLKLNCIISLNLVLLSIDSVFLRKKLLNMKFDVAVLKWLLVFNRFFRLS